MSDVLVRPFARSDRDQVTRLVNAHISAVVPGGGASVQAVMSQLEAEPGEYIVDPWVVERVTLVAEQRSRVVAAAHLLRYADAGHVSDSYRGAGEIRWLVLVPPGGPGFPDTTDAANQLAATCVQRLRQWRVRHAYADGALPAPGVYGIPDVWPHVREVLQTAGFRHTGDTEVVLVARVEDLPGDVGGEPPGWTARRSVGLNGVRISAMSEAITLGYIEVDTGIGGAAQFRPHGWADVGNLRVAAAAGEGSDESDELRRWLVGQAAAWLDLAMITRLLSYVNADDQADLAFHQAVGSRQLTRTQRGFRLSSS